MGFTKYADYRQVKNAAIEADDMMRTKLVAIAAGLGFAEWKWMRRLSTNANYLLCAETEGIIDDETSLGRWVLALCDITADHDDAKDRKVAALAPVSVSFEGYNVNNNYNATYAFLNGKAGTPTPLNDLLKKFRSFMRKAREDWYYEKNVYTSTGDLDRAAMRAGRVGHDTMVRAHRDKVLSNRSAIRQWLHRVWPEFEHKKDTDVFDAGRDSLKSNRGAFESVALRPITKKDDPNANSSQLRVKAAIETTTMSVAPGSAAQLRVSIYVDVPASVGGVDLLEKYIADNFGKVEVSNG